MLWSEGMSYLTAVELAAQEFHKLLMQGSNKHVYTIQCPVAGERLSGSLQTCLGQL